MKKITLYLIAFISAILVAYPQAVRAEEPAGQADSVVVASRSTSHEDFCENDGYYFRGKKYTTSAIVYDTLYAASGGDSIVMHVLNAHPTFYNESKSNIHPDGSYEWHGRRLTEAGVYYDSLQTVWGCDSIFRLTLTESPVYYLRDSAVICESELPYTWRGKKLYEAGSYEDKHFSETGTDTIYTLGLQVWPTEYEYETVNLCQGEEFIYQGKDRSRAGVYTDTLLTEKGCYHIVQMQVNIRPTYQFDETQYLRDGSYTWHGQTYTEAGIYTISDTTVYGCDSTYRLTLQERPNQEFIERDTVCESSLPYPWRGRRLTEEGTYTDTYINQQGGDSTYTLYLGIKKTTYNTMYVNLCEGETYLFGNRIIAKSGEYRDTLVNQNGCDSVVTLIVNQWHNYANEKYITLAPGEEYLWHGTLYSKPGVYHQKYQTIHGCDSTETLTIRNKDVHYIHEEATICESEAPYIFRGKQYFHTGDFYDSIASTITTDTVAHLRLTVLPTYIKDLNVNLCEGDTYYYHGRNLSKPGVYYDSLLTQSGCDSIYRIVVNQMPSYRYHETHTMANNEVYQWHGQTITQSGTYTDEHKAVNGCDSIYTLEVTVFPSYHYEQTAVACPSELPYEYMGHTYNATGDYDIPYRTTEGYDSIYTLHLTVLPTYHYNEYKELCEGESFDFRGQKITKAGVYSDTLYTQMGCDSIYTLVVNQSSSYMVDRYVELCEGDVYPFRGKMITEPGIYYDTLSTTQGCDSIIKLVVNRASSYIYTGYHELCEGATFTFRGKEISAPGIYRDTLLTHAGCDSIYEMVVNRAANYRFEDSVRLTDKDVFTWHGQTIDHTATYYDFHQTASGCDSAYVLHAEVFPTYEYSKDTTLCESELPYEWQGESYTHEGTYTRAYHTIQGNDSIYTLHLTVRPVSHSRVNLQMCEGREMEYNGRTITEAGIYTDTLVNITGCDSIVEVIVNLNKAYHLSETLSIPDNGSATWRGKEYTKAGTYYDHYTTVTGCDSVYELHLRVYPTYNFHTEKTICESELPYTDAAGKVYTHAGDYTETYKTIHGFDSTETFTLKVHPVYHKTEYQDICRGTVLNLRGRVVTEPGAYTDTLQSSCGCDSIVTTIVNYATSYQYEQFALIEQGGTYRWGDKILTEAGVYWDSAFTANGCDSIHRLTLTYKKPYEFPDSVAICQDELPYVWRGRELYSEGKYYDSLYSSVGMDSVYSIALTVLPVNYSEQMLEICEGDSIRLLGKWYSHPVVLTDTVPTLNGCHNVTKYVLVVNPSYSTEREAYIHRGGIYLWHKDAYEDRPERVDTLYRDGVYYDSLKTVHGCDSIFKLTLRYNPTYHFEEKETVCEQDLPYVWRGQSLYTTNVYNDTLKTIAGVDSIYTLDLTVNKSYHIDQLVELCQGEEYRYKDHVFKTSETYYDSLKTVHGCDSVIQVTVNYRPAYIVEKTAFFCEGSSYTWAGHTDPNTGADYVFTDPGTYYDQFTSQYGCDSTIILRLNRAPKFIQSLRDTICEQDLPYIWHGQECNHTGHYEDNNVSVYSCDSTYTLDLLVLPSYVQDVEIGICRGDSYMLNGKSITKAGVYTDTLVSLNGCDSVIRFSVNYLRTHHNITKKAFCEGDYLEWRGKKLTAPGTYYDRLETINGCDSIYELQLTMNPQYDKHEYDTICSSALPYSWRNQHIEKAGVYVDSLRSSLGCDSIFHLHLMVRPSYEFVDYIESCSGDTVIFRGDTLTSTHIYSDTLYTHEGCDSIRKVVVNFTPAYHFVESVTRCSNEYYEWHGQTLHAPGIYYDRNTTVNSGCDSTYMIYYYVDSAHIDEKNVVICEDSLPYKWRDREFWIDTVCVDTFLTTAGCDSLFRLNLTVLPECAPFDTIYMCKDDSVWVRNKYYNTPGQYAIQWASGKSGNNPDELYRFQILYAPTYYRRDSVEICRSALPYEYNDLVLYEPGIYYDTLRSKVYGCDSVCELHLVLRNTPIVTRELTYCKNDILKIGNREITESGIYYDTLRTEWDCDSIVKYVVNFTPAFLLTRAASIEEGQYYVFGGYAAASGAASDTLRSSGTYRRVYTDQNGCDSIYELRLTVNRNYHYAKDYTVCFNDLPFIDPIDGTKYYESGSYKHAYRSMDGFDSIWIVNLTVLPQVPLTYVNARLCEDDSIAIRTQHGWKTLYEGQYYDDTLHTQFGCDSVVRFIAHKAPSFHIIQTVTKCEEDTYTWERPEGRIMTFAKSGTYFDSLRTTAGCDSIIELRLRLRDSYTIDTTVLICRDELTDNPRDFKGRPLDFTGRDTIQMQDEQIASTGCDSITRYTYRLTDKCSSLDVRNFCDDDQIYICGDTIKKDGIYRFPTWSIRKDPTTGKIEAHYDSVYRAVVYIHPTEHYEDVRVICHDDSVLWRGTYYQNVGTYYDHDTTAFGCDIEYKLVLNHYPVTPDGHSGLLGTIPDYGSIYWSVEKETIYGYQCKSDTLFGLIRQHQDTNGCSYQNTASVYAVGTKYIQHHDTICETELPYHYSSYHTSRVAESSGTYMDTIWEPDAHRSEVHTYYILVDSPVKDVTLSAGDVCQDKDFGSFNVTTFPITVSYSGGDPTRYDITFDTPATVQGFEPQSGNFDAISKVIDVEVPAGSGNPTPDGRPSELVQPGTYTLYVTLYNGACGAQSNSISTTFAVKYPSWYIEQHFQGAQGAVGLLSAAYNGGHDFTAYQWYVNGIKQTVTTSYLYSEQWANGDVVYAELSENGGSYVETCPITINVAKAPGTGRPRYVVKSRQEAVITAENEGTYAIYSISGARFSTGHFEAGNTSIVLPAATGCYIIDLKDNKDNRTTGKLVL